LPFRVSTLLHLERGQEGLHVTDDVRPLSQVARSCSDIEELNQGDQVRLKREPSGALGYVDSLLAHEGSQEFREWAGHVKQQAGMIIGQGLPAIGKQDGRRVLRGDVDVEEENVPIARGELRQRLGRSARITVGWLSIRDV